MSCSGTIGSGFGTLHIKMFALKAITLADANTAALLRSLHCDGP